MSLLHIEHLSVTLSDRPVLIDINISINAGRLIGLVGPNGAGKSSLLKSIVGLIKPEQGDIFLNGQNLKKINLQRRARQISYLPQGQLAHWPLTVERVVSLGRFPHLAHWQSPNSSDQEIIEQAMYSADVVQFRHRKISNLSGGECMRVLLARALAVKADLLLADEPITALDPAHALSVMKLLRKTCEEGDSIIAVMHDLTLAARFCHQLVLLNECKIIATGTPSEVLTPANLKKVYKVEMYQADSDEFMVLPWTLSE